MEIDIQKFKGVDSGHCSVVLFFGGGGCLIRFTPTVNEHLNCFTWMGIPDYPMTPGVKQDLLGLHLVYN